MKNLKTKLKKALPLLMAISLFFFAAPILAVEDGEAIDSSESIIEANEMIHYVMAVQWGNVRGDATSNEKTNFDGSIAISNNTEASNLGRISLIRTLLFEDHDQILTKTPNVSWQSWIYNHWDGARVMISAQANANIAVKANGGEITKTAKEFFESKKPIVVELENGREIIIKTHPLKRKKFGLIALWGRTDDTTTNATTTASVNIVNFSGRFKINEGGTIKLGRKIKFEKGDEITGLSAVNIDWRSLISTDKDGILVKFNLDKTLTSSSTVTVSFNGGVNWSKDFKIFDLYHQKITEEQITVNGDSNYGLTLSVVGRPNRSLIKVKNKPAVYMIEDDVKKPILSAEVFKENGLDWNEIETVDEDELDFYPEGESLNYPDGTLVKGSGSGVYVIADGRKMPVKSAKAFLGLGYKWGQIKKIKDAELEKYENGVAIDENSVHPEGALIKVKGTVGVYQVKGGKLSPITSREVFEANKLKWNKVLEVNKAQKEKFSQSDELNYPDGTLVQSEGTETYIIDKGEKRAFESTEDLTSLGYKQKKIIQVKEKLLNKLQTGKEMIGR
ncbi:MAG: glycosyl hydrolase [Parcubacteria group bacterium Athens1014_10]|nr:MAG: glycosyl hydrolase [Parcubacteria group bacterium Athens1014_10]TSD05002.1 MAG: glycosyl hydrolase [Parcubacteria group bacterium Athens0714_12]